MPSHLQPANVFLDADFNAKLGDIGRWQMRATPTKKVSWQCDPCIYINTPTSNVMPPRRFQLYIKNCLLQGCAHTCVAFLTSICTQCPVLGMAWMNAQGQRAV